MKRSVGLPAWLGGFSLIVPSPSSVDRAGSQREFS